jgi:4'-phosphopantetheinyl transferase
MLTGVNAGSPEADLAEGIAVRALRLEVDREAELRLAALLSDDERDRASRFVFDHLRRAYVAARGALRVQLGRYLHTDPASIVFAYGANGKPRLASGGLHFNLSHSAGIAVYAFTWGCEVGVDVERTRAIEDSADIARRFFCQEEALELERLGPEARDVGFFQCWTRKEAYIKALGEGLAAPLDSFRVTLTPGVPAQFVDIGGRQEETARWNLHDLRLAPGFAAALAYAGMPRSVTVIPLTAIDEVLGYADAATQRPL